MKNVMLGALAAATFALSSTAMAGTWAFDGSEKEIQKLIEEKKAQEAKAKLYVETYQNQVMCWSWDACADKPRVYGVAHDAYTFN